MVPVALGQSTPGQATPASIERIRADVKSLSSESFQGRGVGTRGEELATDYIATQFEKAGLKGAGPNGSFFQSVPLVLVNTGKDATLAMTHQGESASFKIEDEFVGVSYSQKTEEFEAEAVFVGHGISAPEYGWDDYKNIDVKGKVVVLFTNEPPSDDPKFFTGKALTYYGRWTYKYEEATRRGALAALIIHTNETAGYPYSVVKKLNGAQIQRKPEEPALAFAGWLSTQGGNKLLGAANLTVPQALAKADTRGFQPIPLGVKVKGRIPTKVERIVSKNVVGMVEGSDPKLKDEFLLFTAHWDHLGVSKNNLGVEEIYYGALDNASGCSILMELARSWTALNPKPKRSALFLATTAEESGLLGAVYYGKNPLVPLGKTVINFNFDTVYPIGEPESIVLNGAERTTVWPKLQSTAKSLGLEIEADKRAHLGLYYRSDHFALARGGVPAFSVGRGEKVKGQPIDFAKKASEDFIANAYHTPNDKFKEEWDFAAYPILINFTMKAALDLANSSFMPTWNDGDEFLPARIQSGVK